ncbi:MAG: response regulator transcription factor [Roseiarcus sp.]|jgi:DNA-binding NarL/FixJ family response regulator
MSEQNQNPTGAGRRTQTGPSPPSGRSQAERIVLIETRRWLRDCLAYALVRFLPETAVEGATSVDEVVPGPARLMLIGLDPRSGCEPAQLRHTFETLQRVGAGSPIGVYLHADNAAVAKLLATLGVAGIVLPSASVEIAVASVRLMAAGGTFLPAGVVDHGEETDAPTPAAERPAQDAPPPAAARPNEMPAPLQSLTARERDVLNSLSAGRANKNIAFDLQMSESTVKVHLRSIMKKLHAANRTQAAMRLNASKTQDRGP